MEPLYEFETKIWTLRAKYRSQIAVFEDRVVIRRSGRTGGLPNEARVFFRETSAILWGDTERRAWIRFIVPNIVTAVKPNLYAIDSSDIPYHEQYAIVFPRQQKNEANEHYHVILKLFDEYRSQ